MPYQPHPMLPADLRAYSAPTFWRAHGEKVYAAIFAALVAWAAVNEINAAGPVSPDSNAGDPPRVGFKPPIPAAPFDCPRLQGNLWLRASVHHRGDTETRHECAYGHAPSQRFVQ